MMRFLMLFSVLGLAMAAPARPPLALVEIRGFDDAAADVQAVAELMEQEMTADMLADLVGHAAGVPGLAGIDRAGVIRLVLAGQDTLEDGPDPVVVLPLTDDGTTLLEALTASMIEVEAPDEAGLRVFKRKPGPYPMSEEPFFVRVADGSAVAGRTAAAVRATAAGLADLHRIPIPGSLALHVDLRAVMELAGPRLEEMTQSLPDPGEAEPGAEADADPDDDTAARPAADIDAQAIVEAEVDLLKRLLEQIDSWSVGLGTTDGTLRVHGGLVPVSGTPLAACIASARPPAAPLHHALPAEALYLQAGHFPCMNQALAAYTDFLGTLYAGMGPEFGDLSEPMMAMMKELEGLYTGDYAVAVLPDDTPGEMPAILQLTSVTDTGRFYAAVDRMMAVQQEAFASTNDMPYSIRVSNTASRIHRGVRIDTYRMTMDMQGQGAMPLPTPLAAIYSNLVYQIAAVEKVAVYAWGSGPALEQTVDRMLDGSGTPVPDTPGFRSMFAGLDAPVIDAYQLALFDLARRVMALVPDAADRAPALPDRPGTVAGYSTVEDEVMRSTLAFRLEDLGAVLRSVRELSRSLSGPGAAAAGAGGVTDCLNTAKQLALICLVYESSNGTLPPDWDALREFMYSPDSIDPSGYRLVLSGPLEDVEEPTTTVLLEALRPCDGKRITAYADGHVMSEDWPETGSAEE